MTIDAILREAKKGIGSHGDFLGVEVLLAFVLNKGREYLIAHGEEELSHEQSSLFCRLFERFCRGEPVAYLINNKEFFGLDFYVDSRVLIPRPETELLVEKILQHAFVVENFDKIRVLEIGTGSGCIAVALAKNNPKFILTATDISSDALAVARLNAQKHHVDDKIDFIESDLLDNIDGPFDIVVANLPYIGRTRFHFVSKEAYDYEPHLALFGGDDGLSLYERLFAQLAVQTWKPRIFLGEFGFLQRSELVSLYRKYFPGDANRLEIFSDYAKIERIFMIQFPYDREASKI